MLAVHKFGFKNMILYTFQIVIWVFSWHHFRNLVKCCDVKRNRCTKTTWGLPSLCKRYCLWRWKCHVDTPIQHFWHTRWRFHWKGLKTVPSRISATNAMRYSVLYSLTRPCFSWNCFFAHLENPWPHGPAHIPWSSPNFHALSATWGQARAPPKK